ncbi:MAG: 8-amino-7-oxononanoate synthase [Gammaproteobacteria bacterium]|nr:8-amino-7-oxononanoate synthase [Gammaproteobacteria bacterium]
MQDLTETLAKLQSENLYRQRRVVQGPQGPKQVVDGKSCLTFCSNDYLGLANHPDVVEAFKKAADEYGVGSGASHLVNGHSNAHHQLEEELAEFTGRERALLFSTGYMANLGVISALTGRDDVVYEDKFNHASLIDAAQLSNAKLVRYTHLDMDSLSEQIAHHGGVNKLIVSDGVFSMDGDIASVDKISDIARRHSATVMIDDAHGLGVLGLNGAGTLEFLHLQNDDVPILMGTLGKAFGTFGAFVAGSEALIEYLINKARTYIYTTALPPAIAEATRASLKIVKREIWLREQLQKLIGYFREGAIQRGLVLAESFTPIQLVIIGSAAAAMDISNKLEQQGILVPAIRPPTVPEGSARLRITLSAIHTEAQIDRLLDVLEQAMSVDS